MLENILNWLKGSGGKEKKGLPESIEIAQSLLRSFFEQGKTTKLTKTKWVAKEEFEERFPLLTLLLKKAEVYQFIMNNELYTLYAWTTQTEHSCGWICKMEGIYSDVPFIEGHRMLINALGGIVETWDEADELDEVETYTIAQNFMFTASKSSKGLGKETESYINLCRKNELLELEDHDQFVVFAKEASGNLTMYNPDTEEVFLYAHDHSFDYTIDIEGQPDFTFYRIKDSIYFTEYVESLARQWLLVVAD